MRWVRIDDDLARRAEKVGQALPAPVTIGPAVNFLLRTALPAQEQKYLKPDEQAPRQVA